MTNRRVTARRQPSEGTNSDGNPDWAEWWEHNSGVGITHKGSQTGSQSSKPNGKAQLRWEVVAARWQPSVGTNSGGNPDQTKWRESQFRGWNHSDGKAQLSRWGAEQKVVTQLSKKL